MQTIVRTTITLPEDLLQELKIKAVEEKTTLSGLIRRQFERKEKSHQKRKIHIQFGKYKLGTRSRFRREEIYADYLKHKMSFGH